MNNDFYELLADEYERITDEPARLKREIPFILSEIEKIGGTEVLDIGCGTGGHARALASRGLRVYAIDTSQAMIKKAKSLPPVEGVRFDLASIADVASKTAVRFDAALCLGNTLPHLVSEEVSLAKISRQIAPLIRRGGILIGQVVNIPWVEAEGVRLLPVRSWTEQGRETTLTRHYVNTGGGSVLMIVSKLTRRPGEGNWRAQTFHQHLRKIVPMELERAFDSGPWADYRCFGGWAGEPLDETSPSIVFVATRR